MRLAGRLPCVLLDGDAMRKGVCADIGFTAKDRAENVRRCGEMAKLLAEQKINVLLALIAPYESIRQNLATIVGAHKLRIVHIVCPLEVCIQRDPKKNYQKALAGAIPGYTGIADIYEPPVAPHLVINTNLQSLDACLDKLQDFVLDEVGEG